MSSKAKFLLYFSMLLSLPVEALPRYDYKNMPLSYADTYDYGNVIPHDNLFLTIDVLNCTIQFLPHPKLSNSAFLAFPLGHHAKLQRDMQTGAEHDFAIFTLDNNQHADGLFDSTGATQYATSNKTKTIAFNTKYNANHDALPDREYVLWEDCYRNAQMYNPVEIRPIDTPVFPVPEFPPSVLFLTGLGLFAIAHRCKWLGL